MSKDNQILEDLNSKEYEHGWSVNFETDEAPLGLNEDIIRWISTKKEEPSWLLEWRLKAYKTWQAMSEPEWANVHYAKMDLQALRYYSAPKQSKKPKNINEVDPELIAIYERLGISLHEQKRLQGIAIDVVLDSVSVATTFKETLSEKGVIFCSISAGIDSAAGQLGDVNVINIFASFFSFTKTS